MAQIFSIKLTAQEINFLAARLGELPTHTGAFPLVQNIQAQVNTQIAAGREEPEAPAEPEKPKRGRKPKSE